MTAVVRRRLVAVRRRLVAVVLLAAIAMWEVTGTGPLACQPSDLRPAATR